MGTDILPLKLVTTLASWRISDIQSLSPRASLRPSCRAQSGNSELLAGGEHKVRVRTFVWTSVAFGKDAVRSLIGTTLLS